MLVETGFLAPPPDRTLCASGDQHIGENVPMTRQTKLRDSYNRTDSAISGAAAARLFIGDIVHGNDNDPGLDIPTTPEQDAYALPWLASFGGPVKVSVGNHDVSARVVPGVVGPTEEQRIVQWGSDYGRPVQDEFDCEYFRLLTTYWSLQATTGAARRAWLESRVADAGDKPVVIAFHFPLRDSVNAFAPPAHSSNDTTNPNYGQCLTAGSDGFLKDLACRYRNVRALLHGHIHPWYDSGNMAFMQTCPNFAGTSSRRVLSVNLSANTYLAGLALGGNRWRTPIHSWWLSFLDDGIQLRLRDDGNGIWLAHNGVSRIERFPYPD